MIKKSIEEQISNNKNEIKNIYNLYYACCKNLIKHNEEQYYTFIEHSHLSKVHKLDIKINQLEELYKKCLSDSEKLENIKFNFKNNIQHLEAYSINNIQSIIDDSRTEIENCLKNIVSDLDINKEEIAKCKSIFLECEKFSKNGNVIINIDSNDYIIRPNNHSKHLI